MSREELETLYDALVGAQLRLKVSAPPMPEGEGVSAQARVYASGRRVDAWDDEALQPGPACQLLSQSGTYRVDIDLAFSTPAPPPVTVQLELLDQAGGVVGSSFTQVEAQQGPRQFSARVVVDDY